VKAWIKQTTSLIVTKEPDYHNKPNLSSHKNRKGLLTALDSAVRAGASTKDISSILGKEANSNSDSSYQSAVTTLNMLRSSNSSNTSSSSSDSSNGSSSSSSSSFGSSSDSTSITTISSSSSSNCSSGSSNPPKISPPY
jgi:hypothetical protein